MLSVMAIQIALTAEELGKIVSAGIPSIGTRKAIYQLTVYFAKETVAFCMFLLAQPACGTPRQSSDPFPGKRTPRGTTCVRYAEAKASCVGREALPFRHNLRAVRRGKALTRGAYLKLPKGTTCVWYGTKASKKTGLARLFGYIRNFVRKSTVFSIWLL